MKTDDISVAANVLPVLCQRVIRMLERQTATNFERFKQEGGFSKNLTKARIESMQKEAAKEGAPTCPRCGAPMMERVIKRGTKQGIRFWGCSNYPKCEGTRSM